MLQGVLGLLTGWALLMPALVVLYLHLGGPFQLWMTPFIGIAVSVPMLGFLTLAGIAVMGLSLRQLSRKPD
ncbi:MAG: hypothetical protein ACREH4_02570 [Vitreimonas sp.]